MLAAFHKLFKCQLGVLITVHRCKDLLDSLETIYVNAKCIQEGEDTNLLRGILVFSQVDHLVCHFINRGDNLEHFVVCDEAITVYIVKLESPYE